MCHLLGLNLAQYNEPEEDTPAQSMINEGVIYITTTINAFNMEPKVIGPWLQDTIQSNINGKIHHKYL